VKQLSKTTNPLNLEFEIVFIIFGIFFQEMTRFFEQNLYVSLNQQEWPETLTIEHLLAVNPCGFRTKKSNFHMAKSV
jgi:hypothetical protein